MSVPTEYDGVEENPGEPGLASVTDEEWLEAHERLFSTGAFPEGELDFIWDPSLDPQVLISDDERDEAPRG